MKLSEIAATTPDNHASIVAHNILKNCQPFIKEWGGIPTPGHSIYRGSPYSKWPQFLCGTNANRESIGMGKWTQQKIDNFFQTKYGHRFRSEHVVFGTGNKNHAAEFGSVFVIFPVGEFSYLWSPDIDDMNYALHNYGGDVDELFKNVNFYHNKKINQIKTHEVMINVKDFYMIPLDVYTKTIYPLLTGTTYEIK